MSSSACSGARTSPRSVADSPTAMALTPKSRRSRSASIGAQRTTGQRAGPRIGLRAGRRHVDDRAAGDLDLGRPEAVVHLEHGAQRRRQLGGITLDGEVQIARVNAEERRRARRRPPARVQGKRSATAQSGGSAAGCSRRMR